MEKERRIRILSIIALVIAVLGLTIAFASLSTTLKINGGAKVEAATWDVKFEELSSASTTGSASEIESPTISEDGKKIENMKVHLTKPKDSVTYTVYVANNGSINAEITSIKTPTLTEQQKKYLEFSATYEDGNTIENSNIINAGEKEKVIIKIRFKEELEKEDLPKEGEEIELSFEIEYVQTDNKKVTTKGEVANNCTTFTKKDTYQVGDVIALCNEETGVSEDFYVISDNGDSVTALAKYNLLVGNIAIYNRNPEDISVNKIPSSTPGYGLQQKETIPPDLNDIEHLNSFKLIGTLAFALIDENNYWDEGSSSCEGFCGYWFDSKTHQYLTKYTGDRPLHIYDENSNLYSYVQDYQKYLKESYPSVSARLIRYEELQNIGFSDDIYDEVPNAPEWICSTFYWTENLHATSYPLAIGYPGNGCSYSDPVFYDDSMYGLRPVITISKSEL